MRRRLRDRRLARPKSSKQAVASWRREIARRQRVAWRHDRWAPGSTVRLGPREAHFVADLSAAGFAAERLSPATLDAARWSWLAVQDRRHPWSTFRARVQDHVQRDAKQAAEGRAPPAGTPNQFEGGFNQARRPSPSSKRLTRRDGGGRGRRQRSGADKEAAPRADDASLPAFLGEHGHEIRAVLALAGTVEEELSIARAYRAAVRGEAGAAEEWTALVGRLTRR